MTDSLTRLAAEQQRHFDATTLPRTRRERGHFGTAPAIADFMAGMFTEIPQGPVRILDPGAGVGTLSAAVCQRVLQQRMSVATSVFELWENDRARSQSRLSHDGGVPKSSAGGRARDGVQAFETGDFVLEHAEPSFFGPRTGLRSIW